MGNNESNAIPVTKRMSPWKMKVVFLDGPTVENSGNYWEAEDAADMAARDAWYKHPGLGETEAAVTVTNVETSVIHYFDVSFEPELHTRVTRLSKMGLEILNRVRHAPKTPQPEEKAQDDQST